MRNTGIDRGVPYTAVVMIRENGENIPCHPLPEGYHFAPFTPDDEMRWVELQTDVTHVESRQQGRRIFREEFLQAPEEIACEACPGYAAVAERTVQVEDEAGELVGVGTLWMGDTFGEIWPRVHWVAVHPGHQGRGIGKCILARLLELYRELGCEKPVYLTTQTRTYRAVRIYSQMGFWAYMGSRPAQWPFQSDIPGKTFQEENEAAWSLIREKLAQAGFSL